MSVANQRRYMRAIGDAFVAGVPYVGRCYGYVSVRNDLKEIHYRESGRPIIVRNEKELYIIYYESEAWATDTIRERVNYILFRYRLGKIMKRRGGWEFVDMSGKTIPRMSGGRSCPDKVLVFNIEIGEDFTYINI